MPDITTHQSSLPDTLPDLGAFVLVGREKLTAVRAEIRAINKLNLAEEVRQQKMEEARMLSEALLDAEVRIGELTKLIPKDRSFKGNQWQSDSGVTSAKDDSVNASDAAVTSTTKEQVINDMGFSKKQISRFETLADNKDLVEQVKAEAREAESIPTRGKVLELAKERKQERNPVYAKIDNDKKINSEFNDAISKPSRLDITDESFRIWKAQFITEYDLEIHLLDIDRAIANLSMLKQMLLDSQKIRVIKGGKK